MGVCFHDGQIACNFDRPSASAAITEQTSGRASAG
jgi:hypothetical protein